MPTIALIDETRRRLSSTFGHEYEIITTTTDDFDQSKKTIMILTQERLLNRKDEIAIDLLFVDEFYKVDPERDDGRFETLNLAIYRYLPRSKQCFMAGPHIKKINLGSEWSGNFRFLQTNYKTVTVNIVDRSNVKDRLEKFTSDLREVGNESSLVFTATPGSAQKLMDHLVKSEFRYDTSIGRKLADWIAENYHKDWNVSKGTERGIAIHHGRLPRSLGQLFIRLFDRKEIRVLICTSTLIEGVNTSAANVFIYDKKINRDDFDFFSFANIRGRVGRMMRHFVGNAYLYHQPPAEIETNVEIPILSNPDQSTDFLVMNVEAGELNVDGRQRQIDLPISTGLPETILREHGAIGFDHLMHVRDRMVEILENNPEDLVWSGFPNKEQRIALAELSLIITKGRDERTGLFTEKQIAWAWSQLASSKGLPNYLRWFARTFHRDDLHKGVDTAFHFLQACEFNFPRSISAIEALVAHLMPGANVSYSAYLQGLENWFKPSWVKQLDEAGIPVPLGERLAKHVNNVESRADALREIRKLDIENIAELSDMDVYILQSALS